MDRDGSHTRVLNPALDREVYDPSWTSDGAAVMTRYADHGVEKVSRLGLDGSRKELAVGLDGSFNVSRGGVLAFPLAGSDHPDDVGIQSAGEQRRLTHLNDAFLSGKLLGTVKPLAVHSSLDNQDVGAWLVIPRVTRHLIAIR